MQFNLDLKKQANAVIFSEKLNPVIFNNKIIATFPHQKHLRIVPD